MLASPIAKLFPNKPHFLLQLVSQKVSKTTKQHCATKQVSITINLTIPDLEHYVQNANSAKQLKTNPTLKHPHNVSPRFVASCVSAFIVYMHFCTCLWLKNWSKKCTLFFCWELKRYGLFTSELAGLFVYCVNLCHICIYKTVLRKHAHWLVKNHVCITLWRQNWRALLTKWWRKQREFKFWKSKLRSFFFPFSRRVVF